MPVTTVDNSAGLRMADRATPTCTKDHDAVFAPVSGSPTSLEEPQPRIQEVHSVGEEGSTEHLSKLKAHTGQQELTETKARVDHMILEVGDVGSQLPANTGITNSK